MKQVYLLSGNVIDLIKSKHTFCGLMHCLLMHSFVLKKLKPLFSLSFTNWSAVLVLWSKKEVFDEFGWLLSILKSTAQVKRNNQNSFLEQTPNLVLDSPFVNFSQKAFQ
ncbi:hypothetical protein L6452_18856 [Arctium lappa]|uniref:Uncharacterized protein n=1 Tax=Arctium lappa TaxID=4217 RepID=A0ACB9C7G3_ARCLA|nr:hypothetical protein L6452_18856 [Arctium lappa]